MRRRRSWLPGLMLFLVVAGLGLMHGLGAHGFKADAGAADHQMAGPVAMAGEPAIDGAHGAVPVNASDRPDRAAAGSERNSSGATGHGMLIPVAALCVAVIVTAVAHRLGRLAIRPPAALTGLAGSPTRWRIRLVDSFRPLGPGRVELAVWLC